VKLRASRGGHNVPEKEIRRRFQRGLVNFKMFYKQIADSWIVFDTSAKIPVIVDTSE
jgi:predicted ABC-type ATPase